MGRQGLSLPAQFFLYGFVVANQGGMISL